MWRKAKNANYNILSRLINCRRLFELQNNYECAYDILSNLFHNNSKITKLNGKELSEKEIKAVYQVLTYTLKNLIMIVFVINLMILKKWKDYILMLKAIMKK